MDELNCGKCFRYATGFNGLSPRKFSVYLAFYLVINLEFDHHRSYNHQNNSRKKVERMKEE